MREVFARRKKVFNISEKEIEKGDWIKDTIVSQFEKDEGYEFNYKNHYLEVVFYKSENKERDEKNGRKKIVNQVD
jgi:hypothetical protein